MSTEPAISAFADLIDMNDWQGLSNTADRSVIFDATFMIAMRDFGNCQWRPRTSTSSRAFDCKGRCPIYFNRTLVMLDRTKHQGSRCFLITPQTERGGEKETADGWNGRRRSESCVVGALLSYGQCKSSLSENQSWIFLGHFPFLCTSGVQYPTLVHRVQNVPNPSRIATIAIPLTHSSFPNAFLRSTSTSKSRV